MPPVGGRQAHAQQVMVQPAVPLGLSGLFCPALFFPPALVRLPSCLPYRHRPSIQRGAAACPAQSNV